MHKAREKRLTLGDHRTHSTVEHMEFDTYEAQRQGRILLAEDDREMCGLLSRALRHAGYEVTSCPNGIQLLDRLASFLIPQEPEDFDLVISDIRMPGITGLEVLEGLQRCEGIPPMILITAFGDAETHARAEQAGVAAIFDKPFEIDGLLVKVHELVAPKDDDEDQDSVPARPGGPSGRESEQPDAPAE